MARPWGGPRTELSAVDGAHLLFHLFDFPDEASPWLAVVVPQQVDVEVPRLAELLLLLLLGVLQLALRADALAVVHVVCFHHLTSRNGGQMKG